MVFRIPDLEPTDHLHKHLQQRYVARKSHVRQFYISDIKSIWKKNKIWSESPEKISIQVCE